MCLAKSILTPEQALKVLGRKPPKSLLLLLSGSEDFEIKVWLPLESSDSIFTLQGHLGVITSLFMISENLLASASMDKKLKIWRLSEQMLL